MGLSKDVSGYLPEPFAKLLHDDAAVKDMLIVLKSVEKSLNAARSNPAVGGTLRAAFNDAASLTPIAQTVVEKKGKLSVMDAPKFMGLLKNKGRYEASMQTLLASFEAEDPATMDLIRSLTGDPAAVEALKRLAPKMMPPEIQQLLQDKEAVKDLTIALGEAEKELNAARGNPAASPALKEAFNDVATAVAAIHTYLETGDVSSELIMGLGLNLSKYRKSAQTLQDAFDAKDPVMTGMIRNINESRTIHDALGRIMPKAYGSLFVLERDKAGQDWVIFTLSGERTKKLPIDHAYAAEIRKALDNGGKGGFAPKGPRV